MEKLDGQVILLIIFVVISGIKWFVEQLKRKNEDPHETSESLEDIYDEFREEIRQRQTTVQGAPPQARHAEDIFTPHHEEFAQNHSTPPPLPAATPYQQEYHADPTPAPIFTVKKPTLTAAEKQALARIHEQSLATSGKKRLRQKRSHASLRQLLASPASARQAIILHEVLGKPKSLQPH